MRSGVPMPGVYRRIRPIQVVGRSWCGVVVGGSGCEEGCGDDADAVAAAVGVGAGGDDGGV